MQIRMYIVTGTEPGLRPARAAPSSIRARLTAMCSGVAQLSSTPSAASPASLSICGPRAARYTEARRHVLYPERRRAGPAGRAPPTSVSLTVTVSPASSARTCVTYARITAIGRFGRPTEAQNPGP